MPSSKKKTTNSPQQKALKNPFGRTTHAASLPGRIAPSKVGHERTQGTIKRLKMYDARAIRNKKGEVVFEQFQSKDVPNARTQALRTLFGNTRTTTLKDIETFKTELNEAVRNPYKMVLKQKKIPFGLLKEPKAEDNRMNLLEVEQFNETFGAKSHNRRKKPKIEATDFLELSEKAREKEEKYDPTKDSKLAPELDYKIAVRAPVFEKGTSKRIWGELYKVIDSSDVIIQVLDARDPFGTRSPHIEKYLRTEKSHKNVIFVLNKCDLVPNWVTARYVRLLSKEYPTVAFHSSITNPFGKGALINLLRQFSQLHSEKKQISVGLIGYPNSGKSSIINTLRKKKVCNVAPIAGETKVWQYVTLMKRIYLIDCPGTVFPSENATDTDLVLKGVVQIEKVGDAEVFIPALLERVKPIYIQAQYGIDEWEDAEDFLTKYARYTGKLLKGGDPDLNAVAKMVLNDWLRGRIPYFVPPPFDEDDNEPTVNENMKVQQKFTAIPVVNRFLGDDLNVPQLQKLEEEEKNLPNWEEVFSEDEEDEDDEEEGEDDEDEEDDEDDEDEEIQPELDEKKSVHFVDREETDYEVVFPADFRPPTEHQDMVDQVIDLRKIRVGKEEGKRSQKPNSKNTNLGNKNAHGKRVAKEQDFEVPEREPKIKRQEKEERKKTGHVQKKNYYDEVNVKNKNRKEKVHQTRKKKKAPKHQGAVSHTPLGKRKN